MPEHTIAENLTRLQNAKTAIGNAITAKGGTVAAGDGLEEFAADIGTITNQYAAGDEGKVVNNGSLVAQTAYPTTITENGTYNTTENNSVTVNVPSGEEVYPLTTNDSFVTLNNTYYTLKNKILFIFGTIMASSYSYISLSFTKPLSELGIDFTQMQNTDIKMIAGSNWNSISWAFNKDTTWLQISVLSQTTPTYIISVTDLSNVI